MFRKIPVCQQLATGILFMKVLVNRMKVLYNGDNENEWG